MTAAREHPARTTADRLTQFGQTAIALAIWGVSRIVVFRLWAANETFIDSDVRYYHWQLLRFGVQGALIEYPTPIAALLELIRRLAPSGEQGFVTGFAVVMVLLDLGVTAWLWLRHSRTAAIYWASFTAIIGALVWFRIDLIPAAAVLVAMVYQLRRPMVAGIAVAVGAATKLWPAMLIFPLFGRDPAAQRRTLGFGLSGVLLGLGSLLVVGWHRSVSPLHWQGDRGLQIESIAASWPMMRRTFGPTYQYSVELSQYNAWEITGPQVSTWLAVTDWLLVACVGLAVLFGWLIGLGGIGLPGRSLPSQLDAQQSAQRAHAVILAELAIICAVIVANKTFSPQYMIWLAGPLAVLVALPLPRRSRLAGLGLAIGGLIVAALTHLVFPLNYGGLISGIPQAGATWLLLARNASMLALTVSCLAMALRASLRWQRT